MFRLALLAVALAAAGAPASPPSEDQVWDPASRPVVLLEHWKSRPGDDTAWARPSWDDAGWRDFRLPRNEWFRSGQETLGMLWYRTRVRLAAPVDSLDPLFIRAQARPSAEEWYWDGERLGSNGRISPGEGEITGRFFQSLPIPPRLCAPGEHVLAVRVSVRHLYTGGLPQILLGNLRPLQAATHRNNAILMFLTGIFTITGIFYLANFLTRVQRTHILFSLFCFATAAHILPWIFMIYANLGMNAYRWAIIAMVASWAAMMTTLPLFFLSEFSGLPKKWYPIVGLAVTALVAPLGLAVLDLLPPGPSRIFSLANHILGFASVTVCMGVTAWAAFRRREGSLEACLGLLCMLVGIFLTEYSSLYYTWGVGVAALILFVNASLSRHWTRRNLLHQETQLRAARLDIELLKKNIQPHFLLHSLRSITDWLHQEPKTAARLVNALAEELRMMLKMSAERIIPLAEEIKLCRSHLEVMGLRKRRSLVLDIEGVAGTEAIPPMVLHTLLEQGLDEADEGDAGIRFHLQGVTGKGLRLRLGHDAAVKPRTGRIGDDTGMKYVRARLEEAFPGRWNLRLGPSQPGSAWVVELEVRGALRSCPLTPILGGAAVAGQEA